MNKIFVITTIILTVVFTSCNNEDSEIISENISEISPINVLDKEVTVVNNVMCFNSQNSIELLKQEIGGKTYEELSIWEDGIQFASIERKSSELMDEIACRAESFVASGYTQEEVLAKYQSGELQELTPEMEYEIQRLDLNYTKDENGIRLMQITMTTPYPYRFLNENYEIVVSDTLYRYGNDEIKIYPHFSKMIQGEEVEPILARIAGEKKNIPLKDKTYKIREKRLCIVTPKIRTAI